MSNNSKQAISFIHPFGSPRSEMQPASHFYHSLKLSTVLEQQMHQHWILEPLSRRSVAWAPDHICLSPHPCPSAAPNPCRGLWVFAACSCNFCRLAAFSAQVHISLGTSLSSCSLSTLLIRSCPVVLAENHDSLVLCPFGECPRDHGFLWARGLRKVRECGLLCTSPNCRVKEVVFY